MGQPSGLRYSDPDYQALRLGTAILGDGFTGRLMANVRDKEGLTYGVGSAFAMTCSTMATGASTPASASSPAGTRALRPPSTSFKLWYDKGVTPVEVSARKSNVIGAFKVALTTTDGMAGALLAAVSRGYDVTWLDEMPVKVQALTTEQVDTAIPQVPQPESMVLVKAGTFAGAATPAK